jgi:AraC-like DNA-binding protein
MRQLSISVYFVSAVLKHAVAAGLNPMQLLRDNRISPRLLAQEDARVSIERFANLQQSTMLAMNDEGLGYGSSPLPLGAWSMMCHAVVHCDTLGKALARYCRFFSLFRNGLSPQLIVTDEEAIIRLDSPVGGDSSAVYGTELALFTCHRFASWLAQEHLPLQAVNLHYAAPAHVQEYKPMFLANPVSFEREHSELVFRRSMLDKRINQNEQSLARFLRHPVLGLLAQQYDRSSWTAQVRTRLRNKLDQMPELDDVAAALDTHPQTLRRRLKDEGSSFSEIKAQLRRDLALHYLGKQGLSIEEIAHRAGFSESSAFIRAFKGWTGVTPYTYRKGL